MPMCIFNDRGRPLLASVILLIVAAGFIAGCVNVFRSVNVREITPTGEIVEVESPVKIHLIDGSVVLFPEGATFTADLVRGVGRRYEPLPVGDTLGKPVIAVALDSVAAAETFKTGVRPVESLIVSALATTAAVFGTTLAAVAIFGSCPTIYTASADSSVLQAEVFANSIVPLLEMRDLDRLILKSDPGNSFEVEVRNEALETHYLNQLELVEVTHPQGTHAVPGKRGEALVLGKLIPPATAIDWTGRDVTAVLMTDEQGVFSTADKRLSAATVDDPMDHIDLVFPNPKADETALYMKLRNSLLSTVLLYEYMLAGQGPRALDWMSKELNTIRGAVRLGAYYRKRMGLRVQVWNGVDYQEVERVREVGPIAWDYVGVRIPVPRTDSLRIRLHFIADAWRIDQVALATSVSEGHTRLLPAVSIRGSGPAAAPQALEKLARPDESYHVTSPGDRFWLRFDTGPLPPGSNRSFFLAAQGYYIEWMRGEWMRKPAANKPFRISDEMLVAALQRWNEVKEDFERQFETSRIPVR